MVMMIIAAGLEVLGIGLIVPVIGLLAQPELASQNALIAAIKDVLGPTATHDQFVLSLCVAIIALFIGKALFVVSLNFLQSRFVFDLGSRLGDRLYHQYIRAPYSFHLQQNAGSLIGSLGLSSAVPTGVLMPCLTVAAEFAVIGAILTSLLILAPAVTLALVVIIAVLGTLLYLPTSHWNYNLGTQFREESLAAGKFALQGLKAIKECKIRNAEEHFEREFSRHQFSRNRLQATRTFLANLPRPTVEAMTVCLGMGMLAVLILFDVATGSIVLKLSLLAVSMVRLMPSFTRVQYSLTSLRQNQAILERYRDEAVDLVPENKDPRRDALPFDNRIEIRDLTYRYSDEAPPILSQFSLTIQRNQSVAFIGPTGCGKTTLIDLILGLLKPITGSITVDGIDIRENLPAWQTRIGYVPQFIFLTDDTIRANVAFGVPERDIDPGRVRQCLETAQIWDFVSALPEADAALVGENGVRLSGGQRQRIGIARALYHNPEVLVLDEATSALDNETEKAFVDALANLQGKLTILMVAHRLTTVEGCDHQVKLS